MKFSKSTLSLKHITHGNGFFAVLALVCIVITIAFIAWNITALAQSFETAFTRAPQEGEAGITFDIEGFENLNLIRR